MEYGCNTRIMTLERFLDEVPDEIPDEVPELHFAIPNPPHVSPRQIKNSKW